MHGLAKFPVLSDNELMGTLQYQDTGMREGCMGVQVDHLYCFMRHTDKWSPAYCSIGESLHLLPSGQYH